MLGKTLTVRASALTKAEKRLRWAAVVCAAAVAIHGADHLRRGITAEPWSVQVAGTLQLILVGLSVWMTFSRRPGAAELAIAVGYFGAVGFAYAHLLPDWFHFLSDSFISPPQRGVTWFSWVTAVLEIGADALYGTAGVYAYREYHAGAGLTRRRKPTS